MIRWCDPTGLGVNQSAVAIALVLKISYHV